MKYYHRNHITIKTMLIVVFTSGSQLQPGGRGVTITITITIITIIITITIITIIITIIMFTSGSQLQPGGRGVLHWQSTHMSPIGHKLKTTFRSEIIRTQKKQDTCLQLDKSCRTP